jgi:hypothetical protein
VKCGAPTRLSGRVSDRPTKLSQIFEMGASLEARGSCHERMSGHRPGTMPSSTLRALAAECDRRPKSVALEHNSTADNARPRHLGIAFLRDYFCGGDCVLYAALGKAATFTGNPPYSIPPYSPSWLWNRLKWAEKWGGPVGRSITFRSEVPLADGSPRRSFAGCVCAGATQLCLDHSAASALHCVTRVDGVRTTQRFRGRGAADE